LAKLDNKPFTIIGVEDSDYTEGNETTKGVKITTKETFTIEGNEINKFHTTRIAIVNKLSNSQLREDLLKGESIGPVKTIESTAKNGKRFFELVDVEKTPKQEKF
jgi:hypothetical protein